MCSYKFKQEKIHNVQGPMVRTWHSRSSKLEVFEVSNSIPQAEGVAREWLHGL